MRSVIEINFKSMLDIGSRRERVVPTATLQSAGEIYFGLRLETPRSTRASPSSHGHWDRRENHSPRCKVFPTYVKTVRMPLALARIFRSRERNRVISQTLLARKRVLLGITKFDVQVTFEYHSANTRVQRGTSFSSAITRKLATFFSKGFGCKRGSWLQRSRAA